MRFAIIVFVILWFAAGFAGTFLLQEVDSGHWQEIALGPITLVNAIRERNDPEELPSNPYLDQTSS
jgi:hypothetical protein